MTSLFNNELYFGFVAGIAQSIVGHPLDTYKTWIQTNYNDKKISFRPLYRGFAYPALTYGISNGIGFEIYEYFKNNTENKIAGKIIGSSLAGTTNAVFSGYFEYKKINSQLKNVNKTIPYQSIYTLLMREIPSGIFYFPVYDYCKDRNISSFMSGGIAGMTCWISCYWADVLNTNVMKGERLENVVKRLKFIDYFKGLYIVIPRAFIVNAVGYFVYDYVKN